MTQAEASATHAFLEVEVPNEPVVAAIDGGPHLVYEAHITNFGSLPVTLTRIDLLRDSGAVIHSYEGAELESSLGDVGVRSATPSPQDLQPGHDECLAPA